MSAERFVVKGPRWHMRFPGEQRRQRVHVLRRTTFHDGHVYLSSACGGLCDLDPAHVVPISDEIIDALLLVDCQACARTLLAR